MRLSRLALLTMVIASMGAAPPRPVAYAALPSVQPTFDGMLSVMTYNVHGLPWPIVWGRSQGLNRIAARLAYLRHEGRQPHVVVLQEAFTRDAQAIGSGAGYRYVVNGAEADAAGSVPAGDEAARFAAAGSWISGEGLGKYVGSGLQILSDYPIIAVRRMAFPAFACAGYDCLASKGALIASLRLPGRNDPIDIVTTHLNSRAASGVPDARSIEAYRMQVTALSGFIRAHHDPARALIVAGDFNVGSAGPRRQYLLQQVHADWTKSGMADVYRTAMRMGMAFSADARFSMQRARDWQFYASGRSSSLTLRRIDIPFGHAKDGSMLSDHVGYTAIFDVRPTTSAARPTV